MSADDRAQDRRIEKTQSLLRQALVSLIREKPYDAISVKEILDRANVGRSTFYMHFQDKDELLVSGIHHMLRSVQAAAPASANRQDAVLRFSLPIFEYVQQHRQSGDAGVEASGRAVLHGRLQKVLAEMVADELGRGVQARAKTSGRMPPDLLAQFVAATFILVLNWWVESGNPLPPKEADDLFRSLVLPTLAAASG